MIHARGSPARWPDGNRREVATRYAAEAAAYKRELLKGVDPGGPEYREAREALRELNPWGRVGGLEEIRTWLGEFDSARTLVEEQPLMRPFVDLWIEMQVGPPKYGERRPGGPPPEWMARWLPMVSIWKGEQRAESSWEDIMRVATGVVSGGINRMIEEESPFRRYLSSRRG